MAEELSFSINEVAEAAGVPVEDVWRLIDLGQAVVYCDQLSPEDASHLVRVLRGHEPLDANRTPLNLTPPPKGKTRARFAAAGLLYAFAAAALMVATSLGLLGTTETEEILPEPAAPVRLVYLMAPGPGGGGGGGGMHAPLPPPPAKRKAPQPVIRRVSSPVPPPRPRPVVIAPEIPQPTPTPTPTPTIVAPVQAIATDPIETVGLPVEKAPSPPSQGRGSFGGVGSGAGTGMGEGTGPGIGPGSGGGTGGGPFQPGAGIDPPTLVREVKPSYTDEARRQAIEGDVVLEIVVRNDGSVGNVRVRRTLGAGLEQKAIDAVRQWKFSPAKRHGTPVDVIVDVSVGFKLR